MSDDLLQAVREARPGLPDDTLSPAGREAQAVLERVLSARRGGGRPRSRLRRAARGIPVAVAIGAAVVVAAVAVLTLGGHTRSGGAGAGGHVVRGKIVARDGRVLARDGRVLTGGVTEGLETTYGSVLNDGGTLKTTLDLNLERAGDRALEHAISANPPASGGAFVALDPNTGQVYAMGSLPSRSPLNRATQLAGPVGSTFAPITALAALESGAWSVGETFDDTGEYCFAGQCRHNGDGAVDGVLDVQSALKVSSDDFFYNLGTLTNSPVLAGGALQQWARALGIGSATDVDLPGENSGTLPTPQWRARRNQLEAECDAATGPYAGQSKHPPGGCGIADGTDRPWSTGDNMNLAVGQGDVEVTPLQLAVVYAAIANGGKVVRPHLGLGLTFERSGRTVSQTIVRAPARRLNLGGDVLAVRAGLRAAASQPGGNSADVFGSFPEQVYGETGTAQYNGQQDYAWYAGFVPVSATSKPIVVVVTVERGGFGDVAAAPVARQIFSQWFLGRPGPWVAGTSRTL